MNGLLPLGQILVGDCIELIASLPASSVDMVFADPPYNLMLNHELWRPNLTRVEGVKDEWDHFTDFSSYDKFTHAWLEGCRRVLKQTGTLWVIGTYHNIYRVGAILQNLNFWILNDIVWVKINPMPNFQGMRFTNAHETIIWAQKERGAAYTFNYQALKFLNEDLQMRSDWLLPICTGKERLRLNGKKSHATQKPEALLYRILMASTKPGDVVLDPFFGTGTTGVVARRLNRNWIGIERLPEYVDQARKRIDAVTENEWPDSLDNYHNPRREPRLPVGDLLSHGLLKSGQRLFFKKNSSFTAILLSDGSLQFGTQRGSIHQIARLIQTGPANGWEMWQYLDEETGVYHPIDHLRQQLRLSIKSINESEI
jgi:site-specific DNA-methyltransferase (adenine-specific)